MQAEQEKQSVHTLQEDKMPQVQYVNNPGIGSALGQFGSGFLEEYTKGRQRLQEEDALQQLIQGVNPEMDEQDMFKQIYGAKNVPFEQKKQIASSLADINKSVKTKVDQQLKTKKDTELKQSLSEFGIPDWLGDLYVNATEGGRTQILKSLIEENPELFQKFDNALNKGAPIEGEQPPIEQEKLVDFDKGLSRKEKFSRQENRYKLQSPRVDKNQVQLESLDQEVRDIDRLNVLNKQMQNQEMTWLQQANINPFNGEIIFPAAATPEQAEWQKLIYGFQKRIKDSYGARITTFEIENFMKRFPTLANNPESRDQILRQMRIVSEIDMLEKQAIDNVIQKYGVRNIDWDVAVREAHKNIKKDVDSLKKEYLSIEGMIKKDEKRLVEKAKSQLQPGKVLIQDPDGKFKGVTPEKAKGYKGQKGYVIYE